MSRLFGLGYLAILASGLMATPSVLAQGNDPTIRPDSGDWAIFVKAYSGDSGRVMAFDLINEIRSKYKLPAYYYNKGAEERDQERERVQRLRREIVARQAAFAQQMGMEIDSPAPRVRTIRIEEQHAVLIGGFDTMDEARKYLDYVRKQPPPDERFMDGWVEPGNVKPGELDSDVTTRRINPFQISFVVPNPALRAQQEETPKIAREDNQITDSATLKKLNDPVLKNLNDGTENSLLDCPKPWTLMVKFYPAPAVVQASGKESPVMSALGFGSSEKSYLNAVAEQSHKLAELLRAMGYPAYVLHTQYASIVTIGSYSSPTDPGLRQAQRTIAGLQLRQSDEQGRQTGPVLETLAAEPMPMPVPFRH